MRLTSRKKEILSYFEPVNRDWVTAEIGTPPFDVSCVTWLLYRPHASKERHYLESTRRTLEAMVRDGLLEKSTSYEQRHNRKYGSSEDGVRCKVSRYGLPGQCAVTRDDLGVDGAIDGECVRLPDQSVFKCAALGLSHEINEQGRKAAL
ncbi:hypothetical protein [Salmonella enterica]|uniref:hypothetical protein n=1 Tax=Salmonella enterica TaxID=28901 RepID=UPI0020CA66EA|nr:hypothetical protein [Salmonella enterica]